ncbi:MAG: PA0069 family radical SAM protein, partial [Proteobacteria bacterium]
RGAGLNPVNRFDKLHIEFERTDDSGFGDEDPRALEPKLQTEYFTDFSKTIVNENKSPDIGFNFSINPYRGCEHGCAYCYARPTHEYLGLSAGFDFESKIFIKKNAAELLKEKLMSKTWVPQTIAMSGVTDCYQPLERKLQITRSCLEVLLQFKNPVGLITKNALVTRDIDLLKQLAELNAVSVWISVTTLDPKLCADLEPRTSRPQARLDAIRKLTDAGIPVGVNIAPVIPGLTDHEMPAILKATSEAGAKWAGFTPVRLPSSVQPVFLDWVERNRPDRASKILTAVKDLRGGNLNDPRFGSRMQGEGPRAEAIANMFQIYSKKYGFNQAKLKITAEHFCRPGDQLTFF